MLSLLISLGHLCERDLWSCSFVFQSRNDLTLCIVYHIDRFLILISIQRSCFFFFIFFPSEPYVCFQSQLTRNQGSRVHPLPLLYSSTGPCANWISSDPFLLVDSHANFSWKYPHGHARSKGQPFLQPVLQEFKLPSKIKHHTFLEGLQFSGVVGSVMQNSKHLASPGVLYQFLFVCLP